LLSKIAVIKFDEYVLNKEMNHRKFMESMNSSPNFYRDKSTFAFYCICCGEEAIYISPYPMFPKV